MMEVVHNDRRPGRQFRGVVGNGRGHVGRPGVHGEQLGGIGTEPGYANLNCLDEPGPEPDGVSVSTIAGQP